MDLSVRNGNISTLTDLSKTKRQKVTFLLQCTMVLVLISAKSEEFFRRAVRAAKRRVGQKSSESPQNALRKLAKANVKSKRVGFVFFSPVLRLLLLPSCFQCL